MPQFRLGHMTVCHGKVEEIANEKWWCEDKRLINKADSVLQLFNKLKLLKEFMTK